MFDRFGPDFAHLLRAAGWAAMGAVIFPTVATFHSPSGWPVWVTAPVSYVVGWALIMTVVMVLVRPGWTVAEFYLAPSGASTPYQEQFSQEDALVMRGDVAGALASFESRIARDPEGIAVRIRAAELHAGLGKNPARAAELLRDVQRMPGLSSGEDAYVGNRLADLYMGPLDRPTRALVELRRLVERYPDSRLAPQLRQAIASLKPRLMGEEADRQ